MNKKLLEYLESHGYMVTQYSKAQWHIIDTLKVRIFKVYSIRKGYDTVYRIYNENGKPFYRKDLMSIFQRRA